MGPGLVSTSLKGTILNTQEGQRYVAISYLLSHDDLEDLWVPIASLMRK